MQSANELEFLRLARKSRQGPQPEACKIPGCDAPKLDDIAVCHAHKLKAEKTFCAQIGLDPLFHMQNDETVLPGWSWTYFVGSREHNVVKIGRTTRLKHRMCSLRGSAPVPIKLFAVVLGDPAIEKALHDRFSASRMHGEWFKISDEINDCIDSIKRQDFAKYIPEGMIPTKQERMDRVISSMVDSVLSHGTGMQLIDSIRQRADSVFSDIDRLRNK